MDRQAWIEAKAAQLRENPGSEWLADFCLDLARRVNKSPEAEQKLAQGVDPVAGMR
jgi:hypothetical protein